MQNMFISKGNLAKSPQLERHQRKDTGEEFVVASMRVFFGRYGVVDRSTGELGQVGGFWREVETYGRKAEACAKYLRKGARVLVIGTEREYLATDDAGNKVQVIKIEAIDVALQLTRIKTLTFVQTGNQPQTQEDKAEESSNDKSIAA